jgi:hypothetical protein
VSRESKLWLAAAGVVAVSVLTIVIVFGIRTAPHFPSLYDGGPTVQGAVAYVDYGRDECVQVLDVATGESRQIYCADWLWLEGWDRDGNLRVQTGDGGERVSIIDPTTGAVIAQGDFAGEGPRSVDSLMATSDDGHATLSYSGGDTEVTLLEADGPRNYAFYQYGITDDQQYAWVCDSEDQLLVVALDGSSGPWFVAADINEAAWK